MTRSAGLHWITPKPTPLFRVVRPFMPILRPEWHPYTSEGL